MCSAKYFDKVKAAALLAALIVAPSMAAADSPKNLSADDLGKLGVGFKMVAIDSSGKELSADQIKTTYDFKVQFQLTTFSDCLPKLEISEQRIIADATVGRAFVDHGFEQCVEDHKKAGDKFGPQHPSANLQDVAAATVDVSGEDKVKIGFCSLNAKNEFEEEYQCAKSGPVIEHSYTKKQADAEVAAQEERERRDLRNSLMAKTCIDPSNSSIDDIKNAMEAGQQLVDEGFFSDSAMKEHNDDLGSNLEIAKSDALLQEAESCPRGAAESALADKFKSMRSAPAVERMDAASALMTLSACALKTGADDLSFDDMTDDSPAERQSGGFSLRRSSQRDGASGSGSGDIRRRYGLAIRRQHDAYSLVQSVLNASSSSRGSSSHDRVTPEIRNRAIEAKGKIEDSITNLMFERTSELASLGPSKDFDASYAAMGKMIDAYGKQFHCAATIDQNSSEDCKMLMQRASEVAALRQKTVQVQAAQMQAYQRQQLLAQQQQLQQLQQQIQLMKAQSGQQPGVAGGQPTPNGSVAPNAAVLAAMNRSLTGATPGPALSGAGTGIIDLANLQLSLNGASGAPGAGGLNSLTGLPNVTALSNLQTLRTLGI